MSRKHLATGLMALAMIAGMQLANAGAASASEIGRYWDNNTHTGYNQSWTMGDSSWQCDAAWYGDGADASTSNVGATWNDRYSSARIGLANCGVVLYQDANFIGTYYATSDRTLRYADLTNSGVNNMVTSITWS